MAEYRVRLCVSLIAKECGKSRHNVKRFASPAARQAMRTVRNAIFLQFDLLSPATFVDKAIAIAELFVRQLD
jgi:hypothetical protein